MKKLFSAVLLALFACTTVEKSEYAVTSLKLNEMPKIN